MKNVNYRTDMMLLRNMASAEKFDIGFDRVGVNILMTYLQLNILEINCIAVGR